MTRQTLLTAALLLSAGLTACGDSGSDPEQVVVFEGQWTLRLDYQYAPEDLVCTVTGIALTITQDGAVMTGASTGGTEGCNQTGTPWEDVSFEATTLSGNARENTVVFTLLSNNSSLSFSGQPRSGRFEGTFQGSRVLEPFFVGDVSIAGSWVAQR